MDILVKPKRKVSLFRPGKGKTWSMKVSDPVKTHSIKTLEFDYSDMHKGDRMLIATPRIVDDYVRKIPYGKSVKLISLRKDLALAYQADNTCPLTTGIFLRIVSEAAHESLKQGRALKNITPFWRVVEAKSTLNERLSFGTDFVTRLRKKEMLD